MKLPSEMEPELEEKKPRKMRTSGLSRVCSRKVFSLEAQVAISFFFPVKV